MDNNLKEKEVFIDIESGEGSRGAGSKQGKSSLKRLVGGILSFNGSVDGELRAKPDGVSGGSGEHPNETTKLLVDKNTGGEQSLGIVPLVRKENENENDRQKVGKVKKASKPPRPPKGPTLDAADMRLLKEISRIAKKKQERMERVKAIKKMKAAKALSPSSPSSSSSSLSSSNATISAMFITVFFFLVLLFQGFSSSTSSNATLVGAPRPAPETTGLSRLTPVEFYKTVMSDDGAALRFIPPKSTG